VVVDVAYKTNADDCRESQNIGSMELLRARGAIVAYNEPHVPSLPPMRGHTIALNWLPSTVRLLADQYCLLFVINHGDDEWDFVVRQLGLLVDTR